MSSKKQYNPNTTYGRKKLRKQAALYRQNLSPDERNKHDATGCIVGTIIVIIILAIIFATAGTEGVMRWLKR